MGLHVTFKLHNVRSSHDHDRYTDIPLLSNNNEPVHFKEHICDMATANSKLM